MESTAWIKQPSAIAIASVKGDCFGENLSSTMEAPPGLFLPPPGLSRMQPGESFEADLSPRPSSSEDLAAALCRVPLPLTLRSDPSRLEAFRYATKACILSLHVDRIFPTLDEIHRRLRSCQTWRSSEVRAAAVVCATQPDIYKILAPMPPLPARITYRSMPPWFQGWVDEEAPDRYPVAVWEALKSMLRQEDQLIVKGGVVEVAVALANRGLPLALRARSHGELRHIVRLSLGPHRRLLEFQRLNGGMVVQVPDVAAEQVTVETQNPKGPNVVSQSARLAQALRDRPLPLGFLSQADLTTRLEELRTSILSLYEDRLEPTLCRVQSRLQLLGGWREPEALLAPVLAAHLPDVFDLRAPSAEGRTECLILLRAQPDWFAGWVDDSTQIEYPSRIWEALERYLAHNREAVFHGGVQGAAVALKELELPELGDLRLGDLQDLVRQAVDPKCLLVYSGNSLLPLHSQLHHQTASAAERGDKIMTNI